MESHYNQQLGQYNYPQSQLQCDSIIYPMFNKRFFLKKILVLSSPNLYQCVLVKQRPPKGVWTKTRSGLLRLRRDETQNKCL